MIADSYLDVQRFGDGSARWLWACYYRGRLYRAGTAHLYEDADRSARRAWHELIESLEPEIASQLPPADGAQLADLAHPDVVPPGQGGKTP